MMTKADLEKFEIVKAPFSRPLTLLCGFTSVRRYALIPPSFPGRHVTSSIFQPPAVGGSTATSLIS